MPGIEARRERSASRADCPPPALRVAVGAVNAHDTVSGRIVDRSARPRTPVVDRQHRSRRRSSECLRADLDSGAMETGVELGEPPPYGRNGALPSLEGPAVLTNIVSIEATRDRLTTLLPKDKFASLSRNLLPVVLFVLFPDRPNFRGLYLVATEWMQWRHEKSTNILPRGTATESYEVEEGASQTDLQEFGLKLGIRGVPSVAEVSAEWSRAISRHRSFHLATRRSSSQPFKNEDPHRTRFAALWQAYRISAVQLIEVPNERFRLRRQLTLPENQLVDAASSVSVDQDVLASVTEGTHQLRWVEGWSDPSAP